MDRINIQCKIDGKATNLQLDKKAMPGETGPCFMITADGCFRGYISYQKSGIFRSIGVNHFTEKDLCTIYELINLHIY